MKTIADRWDDFWNFKLHQYDNPQIVQMSVQIGVMHAHLAEGVHDLLRARGGRRVLIPGNGCWWAPHALVHCGYDVTVVDISPVAVESVSKSAPTPQQLAWYFRRLPPTPRQLAWFFRVWRKKRNGSREWDKEASLRRVRREARPGGRLTLVTGDMLDYVALEPFDVILDDRFAQILPARQWPALAHKYAEVVGQGVCLVSTINFAGTLGENGPDLRDVFEGAFQDAGFDVSGDYSPRTRTPGKPEAVIMYRSG